jgi:uncharacterized small protein (DUF1192 family)
MAFVEKAKEYLDAGVRVSKDAITKASGAVHEMSDKGLLKLEITRLTSKRKKVCESLGAKVYDAFTVQGAKSVSPKTPAIAQLMSEIASFDEQIGNKTQEYDALNARSERGD